MSCQVFVFLALIWHGWWFHIHLNKKRKLGYSHIDIFLFRFDTAKNHDWYLLHDTPTFFGNYFPFGLANTFWVGVWPPKHLLNRFLDLFGVPNTSWGFGRLGFTLKYLHFEMLWFWRWYCWWKKSCTTWNAQNPGNIGLNYSTNWLAGFLPSTVSRWQPENPSLLTETRKLQQGLNIWTLKTWGKSGGFKMSSDQLTLVIWCI